jgi:aryl-alcohol dehydrogenase-like predicted oxidoreductase
VQQHSWEGAVIATPTGRARHAGATYFTISLPVSTAIVGCDSVQQLEQNVQLAREFTPLSPHRMTALRAKAEPVAKPALFFRFVTRG